MELCSQLPDPAIHNVLAAVPSDQIRLEDLAYKYPMRSPFTLEQEIKQVEACMQYGFEHLPLHPLNEGVLSVVGYGPTLKDTWKDITHPCITTSGAHDFLLEQGLVPDYHTNCDGREHQVKFLTMPHPDTTYIMATICTQKTWRILKDCKVWTYHNAHGPHIVDWIAAHDDQGLLVAGGSNIGLTAIHIGGILGYRRFKLFGFDGHKQADGSRHAGYHADPKPQRTITRTANGRTWVTSPQMSNACDELVWLLRDSTIQCELHGDSLQQDVVKDWLRTQQFWSTLPMRPDWYHEMSLLSTAAEQRRSLAKFNTGSISTGAAVLLRALCERVKPKTIIEIGTFIGLSTTALRAEHLYTCDKDNDCLAPTDTIHPHPYTTSTNMLGPLAARGVKADMFFVDGRIQPPDVALILKTSTPQTVYVFDDCEKNEKGTINAKLLRPYLPNHIFVEPSMPMRAVWQMKLAMFVPKEML
jgi:hypothetical protein